MMRRGQPLIAGYWYKTQLKHNNAKMFVLAVEGETYTGILSDGVNERKFDFSPRNHTWTRMTKCEVYDVEHRTRRRRLFRL